MEKPKKKEKLNPKNTGLSAGITVAILSALCAVLITILPLQFLIAGTNSMFHSMSFSPIMPRPIPIANIIIGVVLWFLTAYAAGYLFAVVYNKVGRSK